MLGVQYDFRPLLHLRVDRIRQRPNDTSGRTLCGPLRRKSPPNRGNQKDFRSASVKYKIYDFIGLVDRSNRNRPFGLPSPIGPVGRCCSFTNQLSERSPRYCVGDLLSDFPTSYLSAPHPRVYLLSARNWPVSGIGRWWQKYTDYPPGQRGAGGTRNRRGSCCAHGARGRHTEATPVSQHLKRTRTFRSGR